MNPSTFANESCSTSGVLVFPITFTVAGVETRDATGAACATETSVSTALPPSASQPSINSESHVVHKLLDYDATTGAGDTSYIGYTGGKCVGANFDSTGATEISTGTNHIVVSQQGNRIDTVTTGLTNTIGSFGSFWLISTLQRQ